LKTCQNSQSPARLFKDSTPEEFLAVFERLFAEADDDENDVLSQDQAKNFVRSVMKAVGIDDGIIQKVIEQFKYLIW
jgi:hypothetical protein